MCIEGAESQLPDNQLKLYDCVPQSNSQSVTDDVPTCQVSQKLKNTFSREQSLSILLSVSHLAFSASVGKGSFLTYHSLMSRCCCFIECFQALVGSPHSSCKLCETGSHLFKIKHADKTCRALLGILLDTNIRSVKFINL